MLSPASLVALALALANIVAAASTSMTNSVRAAVSIPTTDTLRIYSNCSYPIIVRPYDTG